MVMGDVPKDTPQHLPENWPESWPTHPVNGAGGFIPRLPAHTPQHHGQQQGQAWAWAWAYGATYEPSSPLALDTQAHIQANQAKLAHLLPGLSQLMSEAQEQHSLRHWQGERCVSADRFPVLGPLDDAQSLWLCTGLGSRGLSFAALCAEQLAALWHLEPAPVATDLARFVALERFHTTK